MFCCSLRDTSSARSHTRRGTECLLHRVVGQWPTYRTGGPGHLRGPVRVTYSVFRVRRSTQLRRLRPERHAVPRTQENAGPVGDRETSGRRWEDEWGDNGARLHSHPSEKQAVAAATRQTVRIPNGGIFEESESILESSSLVIFSRKFSLPLKATHTHTSSSTGVMRNSQRRNVWKSTTFAESRRG